MMCFPTLAFRKRPELRLEVHYLDCYRQILRRGRLGDMGSIESCCMAASRCSPPGKIIVHASSPFQLWQPDYLHILVAMPVLSKVVKITSIDYVAESTIDRNSSCPSAPPDDRRGFYATLGKASAERAT